MDRYYARDFLNGDAAVYDRDDKYQSVARCSGPDAKANARRIAELLNRDEQARTDAETARELLRLEDDGGIVPAADTVTGRG